MRGSLGVVRYDRGWSTEKIFTVWGAEKRCEKMLSVKIPQRSDIRDVGLWLH